MLKMGSLWCIGGCVMRVPGVYRTAVKFLVMSGPCMVLAKNLFEVVSKYSSMVLIPVISCMCVVLVSIGNASALLMILFWYTCSRCFCVLLM